MRRIRLGETGISSSVLGFGCSALLGRSGQKQSLRALAAAWDAGITFFDTARSYGYGESETLLGEFLRGRRDRAVIATKFGILASPQPLWKRAAKPVLRALLAVAPQARSAVRRQAAGEFAANQFTVEVLERSLHESLRKLRTDYVDLLFMHSAPASVLAQPELLAALEKLVTSGKVRVAGISCEPDVAALALQQKPRPLRAVQFPCNVFDLSATGMADASGNCGWATIANHPFGGVMRVQQCRAMLGQIAASPATPAGLREKLGTVEDAVLADVVLNLIVQGTGIQVVVPAMMKTEHLRRNVEAMEGSRFSGDEIVWLRCALQRFVQ
ncbi:MAG TPA: aldo/keto reductase [Acidobacteriaceae bacterium]|nr:aldo/keto reductase [Acidobacteriaceae bacterium]